MFRILSEGNVLFEAAGGYTYGLPRTALLPDASLLCCFLRMKDGGANDITPLCATSADGDVWSDARVIWPEYAGKKSVVITPRAMPDGRISLAGTIFDIAHEGDLWWSNDLGAMKKNKLCWCISKDGKNFPPLSEVALPDAAAAEQPSGMLVRQNGEMLILYSPCPTVDPEGPVVTNRQVLMHSRDKGKNFEPQVFGKLEHPALYAESWIVELGNGMLMSSSWITGGEPFPDVYFLSADNGQTFAGPLAMPFQGQTTSLTPYGNDMVLIPYNQRQYGTIGVWLALAKPDASGFHMLANQPIWEAQTATRTNKSADFENFTDYTFGEPQVTVMDDGTLLAVFWFNQSHGTGIHYVKLQITPTA